MEGKGLAVIDELGNIIFQVANARGYFPGSFNGDYLAITTDDGFFVYDRDGKAYNLSRHVRSHDIYLITVFENNIFRVHYGESGINARGASKSRDAGYFRLTFKEEGKDGKQ
jgi:hypothetical protein